jgi:hypothetical protein
VGSGGQKAVDDAKQLAVSDPNGYVLKPQREGGGNNFYKQEMTRRLRDMPAEELSAFILMERICPLPQPAAMLRMGRVLQCPTVCELGVFGLVLRGGAGAGAGAGAGGAGAGAGGLLVNEYAGYLLRVKPVDADEGGVAAGYSVLSSAKLV